jgi:two-component system LytT family response regulator
MIRTLIVDDAPIVREGIRLLLAAEKDIEVVGEAADGHEAVSAITDLEPDLTFLDVQMPGLDGFQVMEQCAGRSMGAVIFVTAYDNYALRAFEVNALGYLLKPIAPRHFHAALARARHLVGADAPAARNAPGLPRLVVKDHDRFILLRHEDVDWISSAGDYVHLHAAGRSYLVRKTMSELEETLTPRNFARVHRTSIVNVDRIKEIKPLPQGDFVVKLHDGTVLRMSRSYRDRLLP